MLTLVELKEKLAQQFDEVLLLELLEISAEDIVEKFEEKIEEEFDKLENLVTDGQDSEEDY